MNLSIGRPEILLRDQGYIRVRAFAEVGAHMNRSWRQCMTIVAAVIALVGSLPSRAAIDFDDCADQTDRLRKRARDAADYGEQLRDSDERSDTLTSLHSQLDDTESALKRAKRACGVRELNPNSSPVLQIRRTDAMKAIDSWALEMTKRDPAFKAMQPRLLRAAEPILRKFPPELWLDAIQIIYDQIK